MVEITDNTDEIRAEFASAFQKGLEKIGLVAEGYAKELCPADTGNLRNSITHEHDETTAYIGTNVEYAVYVEMGTGVYAEGGGRQTPWVYEGKDGFKTTIGSQAQPYLKPAAADHADEYRTIIENALKG